MINELTIFDVGFHNLDKFFQVCEVVVSLGVKVRREFCEQQVIMVCEEGVPVVTHVVILPSCGNSFSPSKPVIEINFVFFLC